MGTIAGDCETKVLYNLKIALQVICECMRWGSVQEAYQLDNHRGFKIWCQYRHVQGI